MTTATVASFPEPDITLEVNCRNPGQFFACCGLLELVSRRWRGNEGNGWRAPEAWFAGAHSRATFMVATHSGEQDPFRTVTEALLGQESPFRLAEDHEYYKQGDRKPVLLAAPFDLRLDWWLDSYRGHEKSELKVWAGQQKPLGKCNDLRAAWRKMVAEADGEAVPRQALAQRWPMDGRFGFDPSATPTALDVGFSTDEQDLPVQTSPATELLAAVGLQRCRPALDASQRGRWFIYRAWADPLPMAVVPAVLAGSGRAIGTFAFPVMMRNSQYGSFGWAQHWGHTR